MTDTYGAATRLAWLPRLELWLRWGLPDGDGGLRRRGAGTGADPRELQILQVLADGCSPAEVAERLVISPKTVRNHLTNVYEKLEVGSRSQAIVVALKYGLIELA